MPGARFTDIRRFESIDSTNRYLLDEARRGAPDGTVAVADHQVAGRGRLDRRWLAPPGANLLLSVLLRPDLAADQRHLASAVMALAAADAVDAVAGLRAGIKWPNDLLGPDGRKLAGVLAEADLTGRPGASHPASPPIVVGIGINVNWPHHDGDLPGELVGSATSLLQQVGRPIDRVELLEALLCALEPRTADLGAVSGRARQAADFRARCTTVGSRVRVELSDHRFEGLATGVTPEGHLTGQVGEATRTVTAGDVVHLRTTV